ncbi:hypothetical protein NON00_12130, partial [Roseomonas sp. GC11]|nr:hypothetical protein [Roseomonas sp. GC11]
APPPPPPRVTEAGARHPVTQGLTGANAGATEPAWGRWYRHLRADPQSGLTVMDSPDGAPLLQLDRVGEGRVALLLSDQIWLWSRGHDGGGPQAELLRRAAHWLMKEPELEEEDLVARIEGGTLSVTRRSVEAGPPPELAITAPDGTTTRRRAETGAGGQAVLEMPAEMPGVWQVSDGRRTAFAAAAAANPLEIADLRADPGRGQALAQATGGGVHWLGQGGASQMGTSQGERPALPDLRRVALGREASGSSWIGLRRNEDHLVTGIAALPLLPPWAALPLVLGLALVAWRREGR